MLRESPFECASLSTVLPAGSRTMGKVDPHLAWTMGELLLTVLINTVRGVLGGEGTTLVKFPWEEQARGVSMDADEVLEYLSRPRKARNTTE